MRPTPAAPVGMTRYRGPAQRTGELLNRCVLEDVLTARSRKEREGKSGDFRTPGLANRLIDNAGFGEHADFGISVWLLFSDGIWWAWRAPAFYERLRKDPHSGMRPREPKF